MSAPISNSLPTVAVVHNALQDPRWLLSLAATFILAIVAYSAARFILSHLEKRLASTPRIWDDALIIALKSPLLLLIITLTIGIASEIVADAFNLTALMPYFILLRQLVLIVAMTWFAINVVNLIKTRMLAGNFNTKDVDKTLVIACAQMMIIVIVIIAALMTLPLFGISMTSLIAVGGLGGAGILFAAKDLLANFFGGFLIYLDRPLSVGDYIRSPDRMIEGTVEYIGWRLTCIRTNETRPLYVPNGVFATIAVENFSRMRHRRINTTIGLRYEDARKIPAIVDAIEEMLRADPGIDNTASIRVKLVEFAASSLNIMVYAFTKTADWEEYLSVQHQLFLKILAIIADLQAECAYPTQTVFNHST